MLNWIKGKKTYFILAAAIVYYAYGWYSGNISQFNAVSGIFAGLVGMGFNSKFARLIEGVVGAGSSQ